MQHQPQIRVVRRRAAGADKVDSLVMFKSGLDFAKRHYWLTLIYIFGLVLLQFATGFAVQPEQQEEFKQVLSTIDIRAMDQAKQQAAFDYDEYRNSKGWFFTCDEECMRLWDVYQQSSSTVQENERAYDAALSEARSKVGVFSAYAVEDARETWWSAYDNGVSFAKRMSYYDAFSLAIGSMRRDDSLASIVIQFLISALMNLFIGMLSALISFLVHAVQLVVSYQANPVSGLGFVLMCGTAAFAVVASFVVGAYVAVATVAAVAIQSVGGRIEFQTGERRHLRDD